MDTKTHTAAVTTDSSRSGEGIEQRVAALALVLESDRLGRGGALLSLAGSSRVRIGRGADRASRTESRNVIRWDLPDAKLSGVHAEFIGRTVLST